MDVAPLPTVEQITEWMKIPTVVDAAVEKLAKTAGDIRRALAGCYTSLPFGIYLSPDNVPLIDVESGSDLASQETLKAASEDAMAVYMAIRSATGRDPLLMDALPAESKPLVVKVAFSPVLHGAGVLGNFFPGDYPGGIPNHPGPVSSMLTSGLLGAGLGYGAGWAGEQLLPDRWEKGRLRRTLATLGAAAGVAPGLVWGGVNRTAGRPFNDNSLLNHPAGAEPAFDPAAMASLKQSYDPSPEYMDMVRRYGDSFAWHKTAEEAMDTFVNRPGSLDVDVDAMGRTLWESGDPAIAGTAMAALHAASKMPGGAGSGWVTPAQMGHLAMRMGAGYVSGALVGAALGALTGMPDETQATLARSGMYLSIVKDVLPSLFNQD